MGRYKFKKGDKVILDREQHGEVFMQLEQMDGQRNWYKLLLGDAATVSDPVPEDHIRFDTSTRQGMNAYRRWWKREDRHWSERPKAARIWNWLTRTKGKR